MKHKLASTVLIMLLQILAVGVAASQVLSVEIDEVVTGQAEFPASGAVSTGQPNADALKIAADAGYVAVIDLRGANEERGLDEAATVESLGMRYIALPIDDKASVNFDNAQKLDILLSEFDAPVLIHCGSGNRVGALVALRASLHGASEEEAVASGRAAGLTSLEPLVKERLDENPE